MHICTYAWTCEEPTVCVYSAFDEVMHVSVGIHAYMYVCEREREREREKERESVCVCIYRRIHIYE